MAKYGFLKIGEANAEIEKLTKERDELKTRAEAAEENATKVAEQADQIRKDSEGVASIQKQLSDEKLAHSETKKSLEKIESELVSAKKELSEVPAKIEVEAGKKAQQIQASLGHSPVKIEPTNNNSGGTPSTLSGIEKTRAAFQAQFEKHNPK